MCTNIYKDAYTSTNIIAVVLMQIANTRNIENKHKTLMASDESQPAETMQIISFHCIKIYDCIKQLCIATSSM